MKWPWFQRVWKIFYSSNYHCITVFRIIFPRGLNKTGLWQFIITQFLHRFEHSLNLDSTRSPLHTFALPHFTFFCLMWSVSCVDLRSLTQTYSFLSLLSLLSSDSHAASFLSAPPLPHLPFPFSLSAILAGDEKHYFSELLHPGGRCLAFGRRW